MKELDLEQYSQVSGAGIGDTCGGSSNSGNCGGSSASGGSSGGNGNYQERSYKTSNRGSGSQANHFGQSTSGFGSRGGCTGGHVGNYR